MILRGGAGASACQRSAKDDESPFRLSTLRVVSRKAIATADNVKLFFAWNLLPAGDPMRRALRPSLQAQVDRFHVDRLKWQRTDRHLAVVTPVPMSLHDTGSANALACWAIISLSAAIHEDLDHHPRLQ